MKNNIALTIVALSILVSNPVNVFGQEMENISLNEITPDNTNQLEAEREKSPTLQRARALTRLTATIGSIGCLAAGKSLGISPEQSISGYLLGCLGTIGLLNLTFLYDPELNSEDKDANNINYAAKILQKVGLITLGAIFMHTYLTHPTPQECEGKWDKIVRELYRQKIHAQEMYMQKLQEHQDLINFSLNAPLYL